MSQELVDRQLERLRGLLSSDRTRVTLSEAEPEFSPEELGALAGVGYLTQNPQVRVSVYVFADWSKHQETSERLRGEYANDEGVYARAITNGPMLFFAHTRIDGSDATYAEICLDGIMSAFAGDE